MKVSFFRRILSRALSYVDYGTSYACKYFIDSWFYDQQIPLHTILRTQLEYSCERYKTHETYTTKIGGNNLGQKTRQLKLAYDPQIVPQPYYFSVENAVAFRKEIIDPNNPRRLFLENHPETTLIEERQNYQFSLRDRLRAKLSNSKKKENIYDLGYVFTGPWVNNYFHFIVDYCLKYESLKLNGLINDNYHIIYHNKTRNWQMEYYNLLGIKEERLVECRNSPIHIKSLLVGSSQRHRFAISNSAIQGFKSTIFSQLEIEEKQPRKRYYLSRRDARTRRILNEEEVILSLKARGFQIVQPELLSLTEQINLFSDAKIIVAPHGAGLTNIIFSTSPTIIELIPGDEFRFGYFIGLTNSVGGEHFPIICEPESSKQDFHVPIKLLDEILKSLDRM